MSQCLITHENNDQTWENCMTDFLTLSCFQENFGAWKLVCLSLMQSKGPGHQAMLTFMLSLNILLFSDKSKCAILAHTSNHFTLLPFPSFGTHSLTFRCTSNHKIAWPERFQHHTVENNCKKICEVEIV